MPRLRLALAQINPTVGALASNSALIRDAVREASQHGADIVALPEMALTGYPIEDLAYRESFIAATQTHLTRLAATLAEDGLGEIVVVLGHLDRATRTTPGGSHATNSASVIHHGQIVARYDKQHLPNYGVFDEARHFVPGDSSTVIRVAGVDIALAICEDIWLDGPAQAAADANAGLLLVLNGSPYEKAKDDVRLELCATRAAEARATLAYVNLVGGQDELVFDGGSLIVDAAGALIARAPQFESTVLVTDLDLPGASADSRATVITSSPAPQRGDIASFIAEPLDDMAEQYGAIVLGLRDYVRKNNFDSVLLGLSGGIDSTLVAAIAVDALGADRVYGVSNPSMFSSEHSISDAQDLAERTGLHLTTVPISPMFDAFQEALNLHGVAEENLQARIRAVIWMGLSNQHGHLVLACGNKSELATGYSTLYGDAVGGFAPIKDVPKTLVWELAKWRNQQAEAQGLAPPIPESTITKAPSAELRPGQVDTDSLPPYEVLDALLHAYIDRNLGSQALVEEGFDPDLVRRILAMVDKAEYKRRQYPPGPKISARNFGRDRRLPITTAWREEPHPSS